MYRKTGPLQTARSDNIVQASITRTEWDPTQHGDRGPQSSKDAEGHPCEYTKSMKRQTHKSGLFTVKVHEMEGQQCEPERRLGVGVGVGAHTARVDSAGLVPRTYIRRLGQHSIPGI